MDQGAQGSEVHELFASSHKHLSTVLHALGQTEEALAELLEHLLAKRTFVDRMAKLAMLQNNQAAVQIHLERQADAIGTLESAIENAEAVLAEQPGRVDMQALVRYARSNLALCHADLGRHAEAADIIRRVEFAADGYGGVEEVMGVLQVWQNMASAAGEDESLAIERRDELVQQYLAGSTVYLETAREAGFDELEELAVAHD